MALICAALFSASVRGKAADSLPGYVVLPLTLVGPHTAGLRATINGHHTTLIVDTGAPLTVLDRRLYKGVVTSTTTANASSLPADFPKSTQAQRSAGRHRANREPPGRRDALRQRAVLRHGPVGHVTTDYRDYNATHPDDPVGGLIGEDILRHYAAIIDWPRRGIYFNTDPSKRLKLGPGLVAAGWTAVPMERTSGRHFAVSSTVNGKPYQLIVDTGAEFTTVDVSQLNYHDASYLPYVRGTMRTQMIGGISEGRPMYLKDWMLGSYHVPEVSVLGELLPGGLTNETSAAHGPVLGLLGREVLARNSAIIDISGSTLYVKPAKSAPAILRQHAPAPNRKTVMLRPHGNALVDADGDLDAAGIVRGGVPGDPG